MEIKKILRSSPAYILPSIINLVSLVVLTRILSLAEYGKLSLALITVEFLQGFFYQWIKMAMMRFYQQQDKSYLVASIHYNIIISVAIIVLAVGYLLFSLIVPQSDVLFVVLIMLGIVGRGLINFIQDYVRIARPNLNQYTVVSVVSNVFYYFPPVVLVLINAHFSVHFLLSTQVAGIFFYLINFLLQHTYQIKHLRKIESKLHYKELVTYGFPLLVSYLSISMFIRVDRYIIEHNVGLEALGSYSAAFSLSNLAISSFFMLLTLPTYPEILRLINSGEEKKAKIIYRNNGNLILLVALPLVGLSWLLNQVLCDLFFGLDKGAKIAMLFPWIVLGTFMYNYKVHYFDQVFQFFKKTKVAMNLGIIVGLGHIVLAYFLSKQYGANGVAYSGIILNAMAIVATYYYSRSFFKIPILGKSFG